MLKIENLKVSVDGEEIIKGINLHIPSGEMHAIMGPNGSGKSTLAAALAGNPVYEIDSGSVEFFGKNIVDMDPEERAALGLFLGFQYPVELSGVPITTFLRESINSLARARGEEKIMDPMEAVLYIKKAAKEFGLDESLLRRQVNVGFSGGEKKRLEIFQLYVLGAKLAILDETDSGLDIDALRQVAKEINKLRDGKRSFLLITHYKRLLELIEPDKIHVMLDGEIKASGGPELADQLEKDGYVGMR